MESPNLPRNPRFLAPRFLALDIGSKRIGVAVSDELGLTALPVLTLTRKRNPKDDLRSLARLCRKFDCAGIVAGDPLHLVEGRSGEVSAQAGKTRAFAAELARMTELPLFLVDERLTSHEAHALLYAAGKSRQEHKPLVDQVAATLILQGFLDSDQHRVATAAGSLDAVAVNLDDPEDHGEPTDPEPV